MHATRVWAVLLAVLVGIGLTVTACPCTQLQGLELPVVVQGDPSIWTDKADYTPGETVHVSGAGFDPGASLTVKVTRPDGSVVTGDGSSAPWPTAYDTVVSDAKGGFGYDYVLDGIEGLYTVEAIDEAGTILASTEFSDNILVELWEGSISVDPSVLSWDCISNLTVTLTYTIKTLATTECMDACPRLVMWVWNENELRPTDYLVVVADSAKVGEEYTGSLDWTLSPGCGEKTISAVFGFWCSKRIAVCEESSVRTATATVTLDTPTAVRADPPTICAGESSTLSGSVASGAAIDWYTDGGKAIPVASSCGEDYVGTGSPLIVNPTSTTTYYARAYCPVKRSVGPSCWNSSCASVTVTVDTPPHAPTSASVDRNNLCADDTGDIILTAPGGSGDTLKWYSGGCGSGTSIGSDTPLTIASPAATTTYYARWEDSCGNSTCASVKVTVNALPTVDAGPDQSKCYTGLPVPFYLTGTASWIVPLFYLWTGSSAVTIDNETTLNPTVWFTEPGTETITLQLTGGGAIPILNGFAIAAATVCPNSDTVALTVSDAEAPSITCPPDVDLGCNPAIPAPYETLVEFTADGGTVTDNCDPSPTISLIDQRIAANCTNLLTRTYQATDACGNRATCKQEFTYTSDSTPPVITCPSDVTIKCNESADPTSTGTPTATDVCDPDPAITYSDVSTQTSDGSCTDFSYTITRTWTATDACGNSSSCDQTITVQDTTPPVITCPLDVTIQCNESADPASTGTATATDICDADPAIAHSDVSTQTNDGSCTDFSYTITRTWTATDACGNSSSCDQTITVQDTTPPVITCPPDVTIKCNESTDPSDTGTATATDTCDPSPTITHSDVSTQTSNGTCTDFSYTITRTWTATDGCDNSSSCEQTITVQDTTPPSITTHASDLTVECDGAGNTAQLNAWLTNNGGAVASDACSGVTWANDFTVLSDDCGATGSATVTFTATDDCGNTSTTSATFTIEDTIAPEIALTVTPPDPNNAPDPYFEWHAADSGNCSPPSELVHEYQLDGGGWVATSGPGVNFVTLNDVPEGGHTFEVRATDACGNTGLQDTYTWLVDLTGPVITILVPEQDGEYLMNDSVLADWTVVDLLSALASAGAVDATGAPVPSGTPFDTSELGDDNSLTVTARDAAGNTGTLTHDYTVVVVKNPGGGDGDVAGGGGAVEVPAGGWLDHSIMGGGGAVGLQEVEAFYYVGEVIHAAFSLTDALGENVPNAVNTLTVVQVTFDGEEEFYDVLLPLYGFTYDSDLQLYTLDIETEPVISTDPFVTAPWEPSVYDLMLGFEDESGVRLRIVVEAAPGGMAFAVECCM